MGGLLFCVAQIVHVNECTISLQFAGDEIFEERKGLGLHFDTKGLLF